METCRLGKTESANVEIKHRIFRQPAKVSFPFALGLKWGGQFSERIPNIKINNIVICERENSLPHVLDSQQYIQTNL